MSRIEKMEKYIERTGDLGTMYSLSMLEAQALVEIWKQNRIEAILLAFNYGRAKGYRAARKEARA